MTDLRDRVIDKVESLRDYLVATAQELVRIPSVNHPPTGDEYACHMAVATHLQDMRLAPEVYSLDEVPGLKEHPTYWPGRDYSHRPNVVARRLLDTACRPGEVLGLQWGDVSMERKEIVIRAEKSKTRTSRLIPVSSRLHAVLERGVRRVGAHTPTLVARWPVAR